MDTGKPTRKAIQEVIGKKYKVRFCAAYAELLFMFWRPQ